MRVGLKLGVGLKLRVVALGTPPYFGGGYFKKRGFEGWRCTHKAVHTQGGAHKRRSVAVQES